MPPLENSQYFVANWSISDWSIPFWYVSAYMYNSMIIKNCIGPGPGYRPNLISELRINKK